MTGSTPSWHWTYAVVIMFSFFALVLFLVRRRLITSRSNCGLPLTGETAFRGQVKARFGQPAVLLLALTLILIFIGADQAGALLGSIFDGAGLVLLTACFLEMRIYPWSAAWLTIGDDLHPVLSNAYCKRLTAGWSGAPTIQVASLDQVTVTGLRAPRQPGGPAAVQRLDIYRFDLGEKSFEALLAFLKQQAQINLAEME